MACNWTDQASGWNTLAGSSNPQQDDCNWNWDCSPAQCQPAPSLVTPLPAMLRRAMSPNGLSMDCSYDYFEAMNVLQNDIRVHPFAESVAILTADASSQAARDRPHWSTTSTCTATSMPFAPAPSCHVPSDPTAVSVPSQRIDTTCSSEVSRTSRQGPKAKTQKPGEQADLAHIIGQNWHSARKHRSGRLYHAPTDGELNAQVDQLLHRTLDTDYNQQKRATAGRLDHANANCAQDDATVRQYVGPHGIDGSSSLSSSSVNNTSLTKQYFRDIQSMRALNSFISSTSHCDVPPNVVAPMCSIPRVSSCLSARPTASPIGCPQNRCSSNGAICSSTAGSSSGSKGTASLKSSTSHRMGNTNSNTTTAQRAIPKGSGNVEQCYRSIRKPEKTRKETRLQNGIDELHAAVIATTRRIISGIDNVGTVDQPKQNATSLGRLGTTNDTDLRQLLNSLSDHPYGTPPPAQINGACAVERPTVRLSPRPASESWMTRSGLLYSTNAPTPAYLCPSSQLAVECVKRYFSSHRDVTTSRTASAHFPNVTTAVSQCADGTGAADLHSGFPLGFQQREHPISQPDPINYSAGITRMAITRPSTTQGKTLPETATQTDVVTDVQPDAEMGRQREASLVNLGEGTDGRMRELNEMPRLLSNGNKTAAIEEQSMEVGRTMRSRCESGLEETAGEETDCDDHYGDDVITQSDHDSDGTDEEDYDNEKFNNLIINAVRAKPVLYDKSVTNYNNSRFVDAAWQTISEEINVPAVKCRERWKNLRNAYVCSKRDARRKKLRRPDGKGTTEYTPYKYAAQMSFVDKFVKRRTNNNITPDVRTRKAAVSCTVAPPVIPVFADHDSTSSADVQIIGSLSPDPAQPALESPTADDVPCGSAASSNHDPADDALLNCLNEKRQLLKTPPQTIDQSCHLDGLQTTRNDTPVFEYGQADFVSHLSPDYVYSIVEKIFSVIPVDDVPALKQILDQRLAKSGVETRSSANQQCDQSESTPDCLWNAGVCGLEDLVLQKTNLFSITDRVDSSRLFPIAPVSDQVIQRKLVNYSSSESDSEESIMAEHGPRENDDKGEPDRLVPANGMKANAVDDQCGPYKEMPAVENCFEADPVGPLNGQEIVLQTAENPPQPNSNRNATASTREEKPQSSADSAMDAFEVSLNVDESKKMVHVIENPDAKTISLKINLARMQGKNKESERKRRKFNRHKDTEERRKGKKRNERKMYKLCRGMQDDAVDTDFSEDSEVEGRRRRGRVSWTYERCRIVEG